MPALRERRDPLHQPGVEVISKSGGQRQRYYPFSQFLRQHFATRVQKVNVDAGFTCPNRDGKLGYGGCIYCNPRSFGHLGRVEGRSTAEQLRQGMASLRQRYRVDRFIAYFQAYTNTYGTVSRLRAEYDTIRQFPEIVGLAIGTRPDCVPDEVLDLIQGYTADYQVWMEYGLQSCHDRTLALLHRGHTYQQFVEAVERSSGRGMYLCAHVILGLPGESRVEMLETAEALASLRIDGIKIHPLHVVKGTELASWYEAGAFTPLEQEEYVALVCDVLERLPAGVTIQRLTAEASPAMLLAPSWCLRKRETLRGIDAELARRGSYQGWVTSDGTVPRPAVGRR